MWDLRIRVSGFLTEQHPYQEAYRELDSQALGSEVAVTGSNLAPSVGSKKSIALLEIGPKLDPWVERGPRFIQFQSVSSPWDRSSQG